MRECGPQGPTTTRHRTRCGTYALSIISLQGASFNMAIVLYYHRCPFMILTIGRRMAAVLTTEKACTQSKIRSAGVGRCGTQPYGSTCVIRAARDHPKPPLPVRSCSDLLPEAVWLTDWSIPHRLNAAAHNFCLHKTSMHGFRSERVCGKIFILSTAGT
jgi:hypothetical protein